MLLIPALRRGRVSQEFSTFAPMCNKNRGLEEPVCVRAAESADARYADGRVKSLRRADADRYASAEASQSQKRV